jgi:hypothetical protein
VVTRHARLDLNYPRSMVNVDYQANPVPGLDRVITAFAPRMGRSLAPTSPALVSLSSSPGQHPFKLLCSRSLGRSGEAVIRRVSEISNSKHTMKNNKSALILLRRTNGAPSANSRLSLRSD